MIKIERVSVMNWENAIRGARNPMNSWEKSDSYATYEVMDGFTNIVEEAFCIGPNDLALLMRLRKAGSDERKFMRQIIVSVDITAPLYWWKEFDTYKVGTVANSTSTMHKIHARPFCLEDFSIDHLTPSSLAEFEKWIAYLEQVRLRYMETKDKADWYDLIQMLPSSYNQMRTVTLNYEVLTNMYHARKNHKLDEWHDFCSWVLTLPYPKLITGEQ